MFPASKAEYDAKFHASMKISGFGLDVTTHMPCPGCCEPDFMVAKILETEDAMQKGATCRHCGVAVHAIFTQRGGGTSFEFVQTAGPDLPDYLPKIRRVPSATG